MSAAIFLAASFLAGGGIGAVVGRIGGNRELRLENEELRYRHEAWNRAAQRTDLDEVGPPTPSTGMPVVPAALYDQDADSVVMCSWCPNEATGTIQHQGKDLPTCSDWHHAVADGPDVAGVRP